MSEQHGDGSGYTPMPGAPPQVPVARGAAPSPVLNAVRLIFVQVALSVLGLIVLVATKDSLKKEIAKHNHDFSAKKVDDAVNAGITIGVIVAIVFIALYILLALQLPKGKNWARIVVWVITGLGAVFGLLSLAQPEPALSRVLGLVGVAIDIAIIVLLAMRPSSEYFRGTP
jgi:hypothetical protein